MLGLTWKSSVIVAIVFVWIAAGCENNSDVFEARKWLADRTEQFISVYKVGYDKVASLQGGKHPCTKGHKAEEAALFHAVLTNMNHMTTSYKKDVETHLGKTLKKDKACKDLLTLVDQMTTPFSDSTRLSQCGKVDAATAKSLFFLQHPASVMEAAERLKASADSE